MMVLLSAALLLLLLPGAPAPSSDPTSISILVMNSVTSAPNKTYSTHVAYRGILLGGMTTLQYSNAGFSFGYTEDPNYGPFLQSVNGLAGCQSDHTYWELLVKNGTIRADVGIGCYIPSANEGIVLNFRKWETNMGSKTETCSTV